VTRNIGRFGIAVAILSVMSGSAALAGPYADDLSKCLVSSTTSKDKTDMVRWLFATAALHPDVASIASVSANQRVEMTRAVGATFERLLTVACRTQYRDAVKYEGDQALVTAFQILGGVAMRELMGHSAVAKGMGELDTYVDKDKLKAATQSTE